MGFKLIFILCLMLPYGFGTNRPSFRSSWNENGKPILRMGLQVDDENENSESDVPNNWLQDLRTEITDLLEERGLERSIPLIKRLVDDTERKQNVLLRVEVYADGKTRINYKKVTRSARPGLSAVWPPTPPPDPKWLQDAKSLIRYYLQYQTDATLDDELRSITEHYEKNNNVIIENIDISDDGKILVKWRPKPVDSILPNLPIIG